MFTDVLLMVVDPNQRVPWHVVHKGQYIASADHAANRHT